MKSSTILRVKGEGYLGVYVLCECTDWSSEKQKYAINKLFYSVKTRIIYDSNNQSKIEESKMEFNYESEIRQFY